MLAFSQFVTFRDDGLILPTPHGGHKRDKIDTIPPLTDLDPVRDAVLEFNVIATGSVHLAMAIKDPAHPHSPDDQITSDDFPLFDESFEAPGSTHPQVRREVIAGRRLKREGNQKIIIAAVIDGPGQVQLTDFTLTYHANG
jgi:hypothetical protein